MKALPVLALLLLAFDRAPAGEHVDYTRDIKPILAGHCTSCHGAAKQRAGLRLDTAALALKGGKKGPVIVPGKSGASKLLRAVTGGGDDVPRMPPEDQPPLGAEQVARLRAWIDGGAAVPAGEVATNPASMHWAFRPAVRPRLPSVRNTSWTRNPIDSFILARLEKEGLRPAPEADGTSLLRRVTLDLTGLPPSPAEVEAFLADPSPDAYEKVVDRLLASPHYGERMARHWLDLARYADSNGFNIDAPRSIWPYRDWVIAALNADMPFDRFTMEQLAGDLLPGASRDQVVATGFHRNTLLNQEGGIDHEQFRIESVVDRVNTTGAVFLGLTVGCAQCHDHKYDPITQKEYFQLFAFLNNTDEPTLALPTPAQVEALRKVEQQINSLQTTLRGLDAFRPQDVPAWERDLAPEQRVRLPASVKDILDVPDYQRTEEEHQRLERALRSADQARQAGAGLASGMSPTGLAAPLTEALHLHLAHFRAGAENQRLALQKSRPRPASTLVLRERSVPRQTWVHLKGDFLRKGQPVQPGVPAVLPPLRRGPTGRANRLDLARWLVRADNPLTARVTINRLWQYAFGRGLVETENDFGSQGTPPTHPELLDWLATELVRLGWGLKAMDRLIVTSATYRQSSRARPEAGRDPANRLLARQSRLRLEAETIRDVALAASGRLYRTVGGPPAFPPQPEGVFVFTQLPRTWKPSAGPERFRRGMYTHFWRSAPHPALTVFDAPESTAVCTRRNRSNTPLQALTLLNDPAFVELAAALASRVQREADDGARLRYAFRLCLGRMPTVRELQRLETLLKESGAEGNPAAWVQVSRVLLNLDEFITRE